MTVIEVPLYSHLGGSFVALMGIGPTSDNKIRELLASRYIVALISVSAILGGPRCSNRK